MAFIEKNNESKGILFLVLFGISLVSSTNINCNEKSFHCVNSTHFMICVDLGGGVSTTIDDFVIPCPATTECKITNRFECEFQVSTTPAPTIRTSDVTNELEISSTTVPWEEIAVTKISDVEFFDPKNLNNDSLTSLPDTISSVTPEGAINANDSTVSNETVKLNNTLESHLVEAKVTQILPKNYPNNKLRTNTGQYTLTTTTESLITEAKVTLLLPQKKQNFTSGKNVVLVTKSTENPPSSATESINQEINVPKVSENTQNYTVTNTIIAHESITDGIIDINTTDDTLKSTTESIHTETKEVLPENTLNFTKNLTDIVKSTTESSAKESIHTESKMPVEFQNKSTTTEVSIKSTNVPIISDKEPKANTINYILTPMESIQTETYVTEVLPENENLTENNKYNWNNSKTNNITFENTTANTLSLTTETIHTEAIPNETIPEYKLNLTNTNDEHKTNSTENNFTTESINTNDNVAGVLPENYMNFTVTNNVTATVTKNEQETKTTAYIQTTTMVLNYTGVTEIALDKHDSQNFTNTNINEATNELKTNISEHTVTSTMNSIHAETNNNEALENMLNSTRPTVNEIITSNETLTYAPKTYSHTTEAIQTEMIVTEVLLENKLNFTDTNRVTSTIIEPEFTANAMMVTTESIYTEIMGTEILSEKKQDLLNSTDTNTSTSVTRNERGTYYISENTVAETMKSESDVPVKNSNLISSGPNGMLTTASVNTLQFVTEPIYTNATKVLPGSKHNFSDTRANLSITNIESDGITTDNILTTTIKAFFTKASEAKDLRENKTNLTGINTNNADNNVQNNQTVATTTIRSPISTTDLTHQNNAFTESLYFTEKNTKDHLRNNENIATGESNVTINKGIIYVAPTVPTTEVNITDSAFYDETAVGNKSDSSGPPLTTSIDYNMFSSTTATVPSSFNEKTIDAIQNGIYTTTASLVDDSGTTLDTTVTIVSQKSKSNSALSTVVTELNTQADPSLLQNRPPMPEIQMPSDIPLSANETSLNNTQDSEDLNLTTMNFFNRTIAITTNSIGDNERTQTAAVPVRPTENSINFQTRSTDGIYEETSSTNPEVLSGIGNIGKSAIGTSPTIFSNQILSTTESEATENLPILKNVTIQLKANTSNDSPYSTTANDTTQEIHVTNQSFNKDNTSVNMQDSIITDVTNNITTMPVSVTEKDLVGHTSQIQEKPQTTATNKTHLPDIIKDIATEKETVGNTSTINEGSTTPIMTNDESINMTGAEINAEQSALNKITTISDKSYSSNPSVTDNTSYTSQHDKTVQTATSSILNTQNFSETSTLVSHTMPNTDNLIYNKLLRSTPIDNTYGISQSTDTIPSNPLMNVLLNMSTLVKETGKPITTRVENSYIPGQFTPTETMLPNVIESSSNNPLEIDISNTLNVDMFANSIQSADNSTVQPEHNTKSPEDSDASTKLVYGSVLSISTDSVSQPDITTDRNIKLSAKNLEENRSTLIDLTLAGYKSLHDSEITIEPPAIVKVQDYVISTTRIPYTSTNHATLEDVTNKPVTIYQIPIANTENSLTNGARNTTLLEVLPTKAIRQTDNNNIKINARNVYNSTHKIIVENKSETVKENLDNRSTQQADVFTTLMRSEDNETINPVQNTNDIYELATSTTITGQNVMIPDILITENSLVNGVQLTTTRSDALLTTGTLQVEDSLAKINTNNVVTSTNNIISESKHVTESNFDYVKIGISADDMHHLVEINQGGLHLTSSGLDIPNVQGTTDALIVFTGIPSENTFNASTATNNGEDSQNKYPTVYEKDLTFVGTPSPSTITGSTNSYTPSASTTDYKHEINSEYLVPGTNIIDFNVNTERVSNSAVVKPLDIVKTTESTMRLIELLKSVSSDVTTIKEHETTNEDETTGFTTTTKLLVSGANVLPKTDDTINQINSPAIVTVAPLSTLGNNFIAEQTSTISMYNKDVTNSIGNRQTNTESSQNNFKVNNDVTKSDNVKLTSAKNKDIIQNIATTTTTEKINPNVIDQIVTKLLKSTPVAESSSVPHTTKIDNVHFTEKETTVLISKIDCEHRARGRYGDLHDCRKFYTCIGRPEPVVGLCPVNTVFSEIKSQCTKNLSHCIRENQFQCSAEGRFTDYSIDNIYYICVENRQHFTRFKFQCQKGYYLDKKSVKCLKDIETPPQNVPLKVKPISNNEFICKGEGKFPDPYNGMNIYYMCVKNGQNTYVRFKFQCQKGYHLNKTSVRCLQDTVDPTNQSVSSKDSVSKDDSVSNKKKEFKCIEAGKFANPDDCRKYYMCCVNKKGEMRRKKKKCESDEVFNKDRKKCVETDSYEC